MNWISVNEKLPDEAGTYLVNVMDDSGNGIVLIAWYTPDVKRVSIFNAMYGWQMLNEFYELTNQIRDNITHWMPMPTPYEES